jgi:DNA-binding beta-propeller fold protein YncE
MADLAPGDVFAGHRIEDVAGRGGMGVVYRATQLALDRTVALKLITPALAGDPEFRARFVRESRAAASIEHPNVIPIFSAGEEQDVLYISMRFVDGEDLRALLRREGPLEPRRAARIVAQVASALDAAHERGLVHRDVKPANVLLTLTEHAYLTDFGLIKRVGEGATQVSRPGGWVGTLGYVAPEQIRGERVDARADVYALGAVLYHALTGRAPFAADTDEAMLWSHLHDDPPTIGGDAPAAFDPVIRRALAKDPAGRYPSAGDLGRAALAAAGEPVPDAPERQVARGPAAPAPDVSEETAVSPQAQTAATAAAPAPVVTRRRRWPLAVAAAVLVALAAGVVVALAGGGGDDGGTQPTTGSTTPTASAAGVVRRTVPAGDRPNAIAIAGGDVWVASFKETSVLRFDVRTGKPRGQVRVPEGTAEMGVGRGFVWVVNQLRHTVTRISTRTGRTTGQPFAVTGVPVAVAVTKTAVWVGSRTGARSGQRTQLLLKLDPRTGALVNTIPIPRGVQTLAVGKGAVWITNRFAPTVTRVDIRTGQQSIIRVGDSPRGVDVGGNFVWVANEGDGTVSRIDPRNPDHAAQFEVGVRPRGIAASSLAVWASGYLASKLVRLDPESGQPVGTPVGTDINPYKLALSGHTLWLTATSGNTAQQVVFR